MERIELFVGFDEREAVAYHTFCQSVIDHCSLPVSITPLVKRTLPEEREGSNQFVYTRFLVPWMCSFRGHALFADGDMICKADLADLWALRSNWDAVQVVKHDYKTRFPNKYLGNVNEDYPRKNWSSLILWNCGSYLNRFLTPEYLRANDGAHLHRFAWLPDDRVGELPMEWNWLVEEYPHNDEAKILHYTIGLCAFPEYKDCDHAEDWRSVHWRSQAPLFHR